MRKLRLLLPLLVLALLLGAAPSAGASRALLSEAALETAAPQAPPPDGQIEGPCGLAVSPGGMVYLADYYHRAIDVFKMPTAATRGRYESQFILPGSNPEPGVNTLDAVCGLAIDSAGNLYGNEWHQSVIDLSGGEGVIDSGESTGVAIDPSSDRLYVDDRTYVAEYALPASPGDEPLAKIGLGSLSEGFGLAAAGGRVYVADAGDQSVEVFVPAISLTNPVAVISGQFSSLTEAALAIDPTNGHLLVVDNLQPGFERPKSAVREFASAAGGYAYLGALPGAPVDGGPSGIAVNSAGEAIVTDGNSELANAFLYGPYEEVAPAAVFGLAGYAGPADRAAVSGVGTGSGTSGAAESSRRSGASASEVSQSGGVRVSFQGSLSPRALPRKHSKPVIASVGAKIIPLGERPPPQLRGIEIAINRNGHFAPGSVPVCRLDQVQPATTSGALAACRRSLVGEGHFSARVLLPQQAPFPSSGKVYAFNGRWHGRPAILAHVYGTEPLPVSYTIPFELLPQHGTYGTLLRASLPAVTGNSGYVTGLSLTFGGGRARGYVTAGCPAPPGFSSAPFPFSHVGFSFAGGRKVGSTLVRTCRAKG
jgi:DNA-binding beta-propeller fold protein YncE